MKRARTLQELLGDAGFHADRVAAMNGIKESYLPGKPGTDHVFHAEPRVDRVKAAENVVCPRFPKLRGERGHG